MSATERAARCKIVRNLLTSQRSSSGTQAQVPKKGTREMQVISQKPGPQDQARKQRRIMEVMQWEWRDLDKLLLPRFTAKLYPLHDMQADLPDTILVDSFVPSLVGCTSLAKDTVLKDPVDKKVNGSRKKVFSGDYLALRAGIYGIYVAQPLI
ncbi:hypothetical protein NDU88_000291 [Pleurodeles waltl]|uniref:Uncharacterized protein n=1 Tax=Pleurodeles waltl TaxID=8319 RepID=A0AAV7USP8_PLEWA|nr:hypothetical protein NDU88_000291 [Pleurodeles waltl]